MRRLGLILTIVVACSRGSQSDDPCRAHGGARDVQLGQAHTCALMCDGSVRCWGDNSYGQLGLGDRDARGDAPMELGSALPPVDLGTGRYALRIALGKAHSCALLDDGTVKCWGANASGELGLGDLQDRGSGPGQLGDALPAVALGSRSDIADLAAGGSHTCALFQSGALKCWGSNYFGELGLGDTALRGDEPSDMGNALPELDLGTGARARQVVLGQNHTCALLEDGGVKCWGDNADGALGLGDEANRGDARFEMGDALSKLALDHTVQLSARGGAHSCALLADGHVKCWGANSFGALGVGDSRARGNDPAALPVVDLGAHKAHAIAAGGGVTCAILDDRSTRCWGYNQYAALGAGDRLDRGDSPQSLGEHLIAVDLGTGRYATAVRPSSGNHSCALLDDGTIKCWGGNGRGQLGQGHGDTLGDEPGELGDALAPVDLR